MWGSQVPTGQKKPKREEVLSCSETIPETGDSSQAGVVERSASKGGGEALVDFRLQGGRRGSWGLHRARRAQKQPWSQFPGAQAVRPRESMGDKLRGAGGLEDEEIQIHTCIHTCTQACTHMPRTMWPSTPSVPIYSQAPKCRKGVWPLKYGGANEPQ